MGQIQKFNFKDGEIPSSEKWNVLGSNDASMNDGSGFFFQRGIALTGYNSGASIVNLLNNDYHKNTGITYSKLHNHIYNNDGSETSKNMCMQAGWGYIAGNATDELKETVIFPFRYDNVYVVNCKIVGQNGNRAPTDITDTTGIGTNISCKAYTVRPTSFRVMFKVDSAANFSKGSYYMYSWYAWGDKN